MRRPIASLAAGLVLAATAAIAAEPAATTSPATVAPPSSEAASATAVTADPVICRRESPTGSRIASVKVCRTRSEWNARSKRRSNRMGEPGQMDCGSASCEMTPRPAGT
jgi:hypothetical protein